MFSLYIHIEIQKQTKFRRFKKIVDFQNSQISNFVRGKVLKIRSSISLPRGHVISHTKFGSDLLLDTNRQATYGYEDRFQTFLETEYLILNIWSNRIHGLKFKSSTPSCKDRKILKLKFVTELNYFTFRPAIYQVIFAAGYVSWTRIMIFILFSKMASLVIK